MIQIRKSEERGHAQHGWLDSYHTFSFADYYDPKHMGFRSLRVINEDRVAPAKGFGAHSHRDMEILSYVLAGKLGHKDNMGHEEILGPNEIQRMSAGTGVVHSEFNASDREEKKGKLKLLAGPQGGEGVAQINQDAQVFVTELAAHDRIVYKLGPRRHAWVQVIKGDVSVNGVDLQTGDAAALSEEEELTLVGEGSDPAEVLMFDLA
jgi:quercetin 2,3-dioxygenase